MKQLHIGQLLDVAEVPVPLRASGLKAHTLIVGQSGSGKSFMLGRFLEEIIAKTEARLLILDPNSDFVKFSEVDSGAWTRHAAAFQDGDTQPAFKSSWDTAEFVVLTERDGLALAHQGARCAKPLMSWTGDGLLLSVSAMLGFDTRKDVEEVLAINRLLNTEPPPDSFKKFFLASEEQWQKNNRNDASERADAAVYLRTGELYKMLKWVDGGGGATVASTVTDLFSTTGKTRAVCVDLASIDENDGRLMVCVAVLDALWAEGRRTWYSAMKDAPDADKRKPVFVVIDEAHNLAPTSPVTGLGVTVANMLTRIATEGRKYGIYLVMVTQRPGRLDETLRTQCDNLCLMRMNNRHDLQLIEQSFGFIPQGWAQRAMEFKQGELLMSGGLVERATYARTAPRRTMEGGRNLQDSAWLPYLRK